MSTGLVYVASLLALLVGWRTRMVAAFAWLTHLTLMMTADGTSHGADDFGAPARGSGLAELILPSQRDAEERTGNTQLTFIKRTV